MNSWDVIALCGVKITLASQDEGRGVSQFVSGALWRELCCRANPSWCGRTTGSFLPAGHWRPAFEGVFVPGHFPSFSSPSPPHLPSWDEHNGSRTPFCFLGVLVVMEPVTVDWNLRNRELRCNFPPLPYLSWGFCPSDGKVTNRKSCFLLRCFDVREVLVLIF